MFLSGVTECTLVLKGLREIGGRRMNEYLKRVEYVFRIFFVEG
jgi:hypothetical protein